MTQGLVNSVIEGDCLKVMEKIQDGTIDLILCDLPYGTTTNKWDVTIDFTELWKHYARIIKEDGVVALMGHQRFTGQLIMSKSDWFKYKIVWIKSKSTNFLNVKKQPLRRHEDICIFYRKQPFFNAPKIPGEPYNKGFRKSRAAETYGAYEGRRIVNETGERFAYDVLFFEEPNLVDWVYTASPDGNQVRHPVQKPVELGRWIIRTYTRPGEIVLDNACGSGSFLVAAILEGRKYIGIELNKNVFHKGKRVDMIRICRDRIKKAEADMHGELGFDMS